VCHTKYSASHLEPWRGERGTVRQEWIFNRATRRLMGESSLWNGKVTDA
jgi:hypothetical protein